MTIDNWVIDWVATVFLLLDKQERQIRNLYDKGLKLKRVQKKAENKLKAAAELINQSKITKEELIKFELAHNEAARKLNSFMQLEFIPKEKEITLQLNSLTKHLNYVLNLKQRMHLKLTTQESTTKKKGSKNENVRIKNS